jgi:hypothetical protein
MLYFDTGVVGDSHYAGSIRMELDYAQLLTSTGTEVSKIYYPIGTGGFEIAGYKSNEIRQANLILSASISHDPDRPALCIPVECSTDIDATSGNCVINQLRAVSPNTITLTNWDTVHLQLWINPLNFA